MAQAVAPQAPVLMARTRDTLLITPAHGNILTSTLALDFSEGFCSWCSFNVFIVTIKVKEIFFTLHSYCVVKLFIFLTELKEKLPLYLWRAEMDLADSVRVKEVRTS